MIQLEVGKSYEVRKPDLVKKMFFETVVKIISDDSGEKPCIFVGNNGARYMPDGRISDLYSGVPFDLVKEVSE